MSYEFETSKLRGKIVEKFGTVDAFSQAASLTRASISDYLNGKKYLSQKDIFEWMDILGIDRTEVFDYFFTKKVSETKLNEV